MLFSPDTAPALTVHEQPVSGEHPDEHQQDREGEGQQLSEGESPAAPEGDPAVEMNPNKRERTEEAARQSPSTQHHLPHLHPSAPNEQHNSTPEL